MVPAGISSTIWSISRSCEDRTQFLFPMSEDEQHYFLFVVWDDIAV